MTVFIMMAVALYLAYLLLPYTTFFQFSVEQAFKRATEYTDRYYLDPEKIEEMNKADKAQLEDEMQDIVDDNFVNWTTAQIEIC